MILYIQVMNGYKNSSVVGRVLITFEVLGSIPSTKKGGEVGRVK